MIPFADLVRLLILPIILFGLGAFFSDGYFYLWPIGFVMGLIVMHLSIPRFLKEWERVGIPGKPKTQAQQELWQKEKTERNIKRNLTYLVAIIISGWIRMSKKEWVLPGIPFLLGFSAGYLLRFFWLIYQERGWLKLPESDGSYLLRYFSVGKFKRIFDNYSIFGKVIYILVSLLAVGGAIVLTRLGVTEFWEVPSFKNAQFLVAAVLFSFGFLMLPLLLMRTDTDPTDSGDNTNSLKKGYFYIKDTMSVLDTQTEFRQGDKVIWCKEKFAKNLCWGVEVKIIGKTAQRVKISYKEYTQTKTVYVKPENLILKEYADWNVSEYTA